MLRSGRFCDYLFLVAAFCFSFWLMFHTFHYRASDHTMLISNLVYSDFMSHIPMIRSFSLGHNWPPEFPLFPGEPIRYHFVFFAVVGLLERLGLRIDWALNLPSALGFFALLCTIYFAASALYSDRRVGWLSVVFFLFNGSMSFWNFVTKHPFDSNFFSELWKISSYPSFGPWDGSEIGAFWNWNIFVNQRHLAFALAFVLFCTFCCFFVEKLTKYQQCLVGAILGIIAGLFPLYHQPALLMLGITFGIYLFVLPRVRSFVVSFCAFTVIFVGFQLPFLKEISGHAGSQIAFYPGYLMHDNLSVGHVFTYWFKNIGLHLFLIPLGVLLSPKKVRLWYLPALAIFIMAFLIRFGTEAALNHKFFNYSLIVAQMASAVAIVALWDAATICRKVNSLASAGIMLVTVGLLLACTVSGVVDALVVKNSFSFPIVDLPENDVAEWIFRNTPPRSVFLNSTYAFSPASLAGRPVLVGWPYFSAGLGYDVDGRERIARTIFAGNDPNLFCPLLKKLNASYVMIEHSLDPAFPPINDPYFLSHFTASYHSKNGRVSIFETNVLCSSLRP